MKPKPVVLVVLDGWGEAPAGEHNAILQAHIPTWRRITRDYPHTVLNASELHVGLPEGQMGNSEVGHMNIGSGRVVMQDLPRIDAAFADGSLAASPKLREFVAALKASGGKAHLLGLISPGGVHSHQAHVEKLAAILAKQGIAVRVHAFLDGRDTPPQSALEYIAALENALAVLPDARIATVCGRYYAMDRDKRWDRVQKAYAALAEGQGGHAGSAREGIEASYEAGKNDEFVLPLLIDGYDGMKDGDGVLMANFRADRVREILTAVADPAFSEFPRPRRPRLAAVLGMAEYSAQLAAYVPALFPPVALTNILGEIVADAGMKQLRIAETEKYAHVTFFFNGGREQEFPGEERILVPSPKVATYDLKPEMSAPEMTDKLVEAVESERFDLIVVNYANTDMVGHTGSVPAAIKAVEAVDACLGRLVAAVEAKGGAMLVTADHGNAEMMFDHETEQAHTAHTLNLVPAVLIHPALKNTHPPLREGRLADIAPTLLAWLGLEQPAEMTGASLLPS